MKDKYIKPVLELIIVEKEGLYLMNPKSVTENGQTSPDIKIGGNSGGNKEADGKSGFFDDNKDGDSYRNFWDD